MHSLDIVGHKRDSKMGGDKISYNLEKLLSFSPKRNFPAFQNKGANGLLSFKMKNSIIKLGLLHSLGNFGLAHDVDAEEDDGITQCCENG